MVHSIIKSERPLFCYRPSTYGTLPQPMLRTYEALKSAELSAGTVVPHYIKNRTEGMTVLQVPNAGITVYL